jgi:2-amino-4-hydroxy-6-hydroxymethyldihydropteridine diphosphokinase
MAGKSNTEFETKAGCALIGLGSNVAFGALAGPDLLAAAVAGLAQAGLPVERVSRVWQSPAWPDPSDPAFVNAVALIGPVTLSADQVYQILQQTEVDFGRVRRARNAPRTLDLDLLDFNQTAAASPAGLILPHPRLHERAFVLGPMCDIAPDWVHPVLGVSARTLFSELPPHQARPIAAG